MSPPAKPRLAAVLLAGGSGTRLWPLSTQRQPKQFLALGGERSLLQQSADRIIALAPPERLWVVCGEIHAAAAAAQLKEMPDDQVLVEPAAKNTLAAIALAAIHLRAKDPESVMAVLPADHFIPQADWPKLRADLSLAAAVARREKALVTLGIRPTEPATGFGYLERGEAFREGESEYFEVKAFHEKPDAETARRYLESGGCFWNSGMFVWEPQVFLEELARLRPETARAFEALALRLSDAAYPRLLAEVFAGLESVSVDYGVMERAAKVRMIPASFAWDDVGALSSLENILPGDARGNHTQGPSYILDGSGNLVLAERRAVALVGMDGVIVVETPNAVLVLPKDRAQDVKKLVEHLKTIGREDLL
ncbi:MAG: mannose-1-phosphate guanylyltransferase [Deltaproteobacteria bacterium]|nr:mannose-1-phosphate guanylyltransferase [Deltaproteobacteria bacterium]